MVKPNFILTAAGLHLGLLALSFWFSNSRNAEEETSDENSSQSTQGNDSRNQNFTCSKCIRVIATKDLKILSCGHKLHQQCYQQMQEDDILFCPACCP